MFTMDAYTNQVNREASKGEETNNITNQVRHIGP